MRSGVTTPLISVVVPVYQAEKFLNRCVDSILQQTYQNLEVILVDDGSTDASSSICDLYAAKDERVRSIHTQNQGVGAARNTGLDVCTGDYIAFVDSDDYILPDMYNEMLKCIQTESVDVCVCQWMYQYENGRLVHPQNDEVRSITGKIKSIDFAYYLYKTSYTNGVVVSPWNKLYKREIFDRIRFSGRFVEDDEIHDKIFSQDIAVYVMKEGFYVYCHNEQSLTNRKFNLDNLRFLEVLKTRCELYMHDSFLRFHTMQLYCNLYIEYYYKAKAASLHMPDRNTFDLYVKKLRKEKECTAKFQIRMYLFRFLPQLYDYLLNKH